MRKSTRRLSVTLLFITFAGLMSAPTAPTILCKSGNCVFSPGDWCLDGEFWIRDHIEWEGYKG